MMFSPLVLVADTGRGLGHVQLVHRIELELDFFPGLERDGQFRARLAGLGENVLGLLLERATLVARLHASLERHAVGRGAGRVAPGMTQGAAAELKHRIVAEDGDQRRLVPHVKTAGGHREHAGHGAPVLIEEDAASAVVRYERFTQQIDEAERRAAIAFELADHGTGVDVVTARQAQTLSQHAEVDAVLGMAVDHRVHGAMDVQQHAILAAPLGETGIGGEAGGLEVVHDDGHAQYLGELRALGQGLGSGCGHVQVLTLALARLLLGLVDGLGHELEAVLPAHEWLRVEVLVVLCEVETAAQTLVHRAAVVLRRQAELGLDSAAQQWTAILVHLVALDLDAVRRSEAGLDVGDGEADVLEAQVLDRLEAEYVADQRGQHVDDGAFFEEIDRIGDEGVESLLVARHRLDAIGAAFVVIKIRQQVRPHRGPGAGGRLGGDGRGRYFARLARLRRDLETRQQVRAQWNVVGGPVCLAIFLYPG